MRSETCASAILGFAREMRGPHCGLRRPRTRAISPVVSPAEHPQRQRDTGRERLGGMTAGEDQPQPVALRRAAVVNQAPGLTCTPSRGHAVTAAANASGTASSAGWKSPPWWIGVASTDARSRVGALDHVADHAADCALISRADVWAGNIIGRTWTVP